MVLPPSSEAQLAATAAAMITAAKAAMSLCLRITPHLSAHKPDAEKTLLRAWVRCSTHARTSVASARYPQAEPASRRGPKYRIPKRSNVIPRCQGQRSGTVGGGGQASGEVTVLPFTQRVSTCAGPCTVEVTVVVTVVGTVAVSVGEGTVVVTVVVSVDITVVVDVGAAAVTTTVAVPDRPSEVARTVMRAGDPWWVTPVAVAIPAPSTPTALVSAELHSTGPAISAVEPSSYVPIAFSCRRSPTVSVTSDGVTLIAVRVGCAVTVGLVGAARLVVGPDVTDAEVVARVVACVVSVTGAKWWGSTISAAAGIPSRTPSARISVKGWRYQGRPPGSRCVLASKSGTKAGVASARARISLSDGDMSGDTRIGLRAKGERFRQARSTAPHGRVAGRHRPSAWSIAPVADRGECRALWARGPRRA